MVGINIWSWFDQQTFYIIWRRASLTIYRINWFPIDKKIIISFVDFYVNTRSGGKFYKQIHLFTNNYMSISMASFGLLSIKETMFGAILRCVLSCESCLLCLNPALDHLYCWKMMKFILLASLLALARVIFAFYSPILTFLFLSLSWKSVHNLSSIDSRQCVSLCFDNLQ